MTDGGGDASTSAAPPPTGGVTAGPVKEFKGVILSKRPETTLSAQVRNSSQTQASGNSARPFLPAGTTGINDLGLNPARDKDRTITFTKTAAPSGLSKVYLRHRAYLKHLAEQQKENREEAEAVIKAEEHRWSHFAEKERKKRNLIRDSKPKNSEEAEKIFTSTWAAAGTQKRKSRKKAKPVWAMTEKEVENKETAEVDELLDFAESLDYDQYMEDLEQKVEMVSVDQSREEEEAEEEGKSEKKEHAMREHRGSDAGADEDAQMSDAGSEEYGVARYHIRDDDEQSVTGSVASSTRHSAISTTSSRRSSHRSAVDDGTRSIAGSSATSTQSAKEILRQNQQLSHVHSQRSLARIIERQQKKQPTTAKSQSPGPRVAVHDGNAVPEKGLLTTIPETIRRALVMDDSVIMEGTAERTKAFRKDVDVQRLPYLYRCPAI